MLLFWRFSEKVPAHAATVKRVLIRQLTCTLMEVAGCCSECLAESDTCNHQTAAKTRYRLLTILQTPTPDIVKSAPTAARGDYIQVILQ